MATLLQDKVDTFQRQAGSILHIVANDADDSWGNEDTREVYTGAKFDGVGKEDNDRLGLAAKGHYQPQSLGNRLPDGCMDAENILLHLPSHLGCSWCDGNAAEDLVKAELLL